MVHDESPWWVHFPRMILKLKDYASFLVACSVQLHLVGGLSSISPGALPTRVLFSEVLIDGSSTSENNADVTKDGTSIGERVKSGESVLELRQLASPEECDWLVDACMRAAEEATPTRQLDKPGLVRLPTIAAAERAGVTKTLCADPLPDDIDAALQTLLRRATEYIDRELPSLPLVLFGTDSLTSLLIQNRLKYSSREPAINIYTEGGEFLPHKDAQALTVLLPLSHPGRDFVGGGTAFWHQDARGHRVEGPSLVRKPPGGTAMLFGGCVTHSGVSIESGSRVVFVASFSPETYAITTDQRDIYGDSM